jgi:hypothetical protein
MAEIVLHRVFESVMMSFLLGWCLLLVVAWFVAGDNFFFSSFLSSLLEICVARAKF